MVNEGKTKMADKGEYTTEEDMKRNKRIHTLDFNQFDFLPPRCNKASRHIFNSACEGTPGPPGGRLPTRRTARRRPNEAG